MRSFVLPQKRNLQKMRENHCLLRFRKGGRNRPCVLWQGVDNVEREQAEETQENPEQRYCELTEFLPISVFEIDTSGNLISFNQSTLRTFGFSQEDFEEGT